MPAGAADHAVGLRELRHKTSEVLARVRNGETIDVTEYGKLIARIVPAAEPKRSPAIERLIAEGRLKPAKRPGQLPPLLPGDGTNRLSDELQRMRDEERW